MLVIVAAVATLGLILWLVPGASEVWIPLVAMFIGLTTVILIWLEMVVHERLRN